MIPAALRDAIAEEAAQVTALAEAMAGAQVARASVDAATLLHRDIALQPPGLWSPNRHCQLVQAADGWIAVNLARPDDAASVAAWLECDIADAPWQAVQRHVRHRSIAWLLERAALLGLPVSAVGEAPLPPARALYPATRPGESLRVLDLSALWAGPLCGALLAQAGMQVTKAHDPARPDPIAGATPVLDQRLNGGKRRIALDFTSSALGAAIAAADVLITSARAHALARLGVTPDAVFSSNPGMLWVAITAHGFSGPGAMRVGFGDDTAAAGGLIAWNDGAPAFIGDALADPLNGLRAAHLALQAVAQSQAGLIDVALATTAADFAMRAGLR